MVEQILHDSGKIAILVGLVLFLCSDAVSYLTGQIMHVDGGKVMS